ncbi:MAG: tetratricopeptide repeat protein [Candidatus Caldatribacteriota bacterium]|nr:tetratricopeptide repeat protein [Candidatus Caldatribacteriota bacterium]
MTNIKEKLILIFFIALFISISIFNLSAYADNSDIIGFDYWEKGFYREAFEQWVNFVSENPNSPDAEVYWIMAEEIADKIGKYEEFISLSKEIVEKNYHNKTLQTYAQKEIAQSHIRENNIFQAGQEIKELGLITDWLIIGPFDNTGKSGFEKVYPPEEEIDLHKTYRGKNSLQIKWFKPKRVSLSGFINFNTFLYPNNWSVGYALTYVYSSCNRPVVFKVGADDAVKVWLNNGVVIEQDIYRKAVIDQEAVPVLLNEGWNKILVKVCEKENAWGFYFRINDLEGNLVAGLKYDPEYNVKAKAFKLKSMEEEIKETDYLRDAVSSYKEKIINNPQDFKAHLFLGLLFQKKEYLDKAIEEFKKVVSIDSNNALAHFLLGNVYRQEEKLDKGQEEIKKALKIDSNFIQASLQVGINYYEKGLYKEAIEEFKKILEKNPDFLEANLYLSWTYERKGWNLEARKKLEKLAESNPSYALIQYCLGVSYERKGWYDKAIQQYKKVLEKNYNDSMARGRLTGLYFQLGKFDEGIALYKEILSWKSDDPSIYRNIADAYVMMGKREKAIEILEEAKEIFPYNSSIYSQLGHLYHEQQKEDRAMGLWKQALEISPEFLYLRDYMDFISEKEEITGADARKLIAKAPSAEEYPDASAAILLNETRKVIHQDGTSSTTFHKIIKLFNRRGIEKYGEVFITYNAWGERIIIKKARTFKLDGTMIEATSIKDIFPLEGYRLYSNISQKVISMPALEEGVIIEYQYTLDDYNRGFVGKNFQDTFYLQDFEPIQNYKYILTVPEGVEFKTVNFSTDITHEVKKLDNEAIYTWEASNISQIIYENSMPPFHDITPHVTVSSFSSWEEIISWYYDISREQSKADADIKAKVAELIQGKENDEEKIRAIYHYVISEIRYLGLEFAISGHMPHEAAEIFKYKYGDCKDKATLLIAMLREAGIDAYYVLLRTRNNGNLERDLPGFQFNHAIAAVSLNGELMFLDGTAENYTFGILPSMDQDAWSIVLIEGKGKFMKIPIQPAEKNKRIREIKLDLGEDGRIRGEAVVSQFGIFAAYSRSIFKDLGEIKRGEAIQSSLSSSCPGSVLEEFSFSDLTDLNIPVEQKYKFRVPNYAKKIGDKIQIKPSIIERVESTSIAAKEERRYPMYFHNQYCTKNKIEINIPDNFKIERIPEDIELELPFASYKVKYLVEGNTIEYERDYKFNTFEISLKDYPAFKEFIEKVVKEDAKEIVIKSD